MKSMHNLFSIYEEPETEEGDEHGHEGVPPDSPPSVVPTNARVPALRRVRKKLTKHDSFT